MLNERGYERETNCTGMLRKSSRLLRAQRVHRACRICVDANELADWHGHLSLTDGPVAQFPPNKLSIL